MTEREIFLAALEDYCKTARDGDAGSLEESIPGDLDGLLEDVRAWVDAWAAMHR